MRDTKEIAELLAEPFAENEIGFKPQATSKDGNKALACAYIDARNVMDRLDAVVGPENWQDDFTVMPNGNVVCKLSLRIGGEWIGKTDVGGESDQKDSGDREKAAFSDALKRAAVKWGIGRYLYNLPAVWCDYDSQKKQFKGTPKLPPEALPKRTAQPAPQPAKAQPPKPVLPRDGIELFGRLKDLEAAMVAKGLCEPRDVTKHVELKGEGEGYTPILTDWIGEQIEDGMRWAREFKDSCRGNRQPAAAGVK